MRAAIYARYSTDLQKETSVEDQIRQAERCGHAHGFTVVATFFDAAVSGGTADRPGYQALLDAARRKEFDVILTEDVSRLWRNRATYGQDSAELEDLGVQLVTCVGDDTRRDGYGLVLGIKSAIAEHQRREISYRTRRGMEGVARAGRSTGGRCYGYGSPAEADTVRWMFRSRQQGMELREMVAALTRAGTPAPRGPRWSYNAVKRILANPRYAGALAWGRKQRSGGARNSRSWRAVERPGGPLVIRQIEPLVEKSVWEACNPGSTGV